MFGLSNRSGHCQWTIHLQHAGRTLDRPVFQRLHRDALRSRFAAVVIHRYNGLARDQTDALALQLQLRHDHRVGVFSATEASLDEGAPNAALHEGLDGAAAAFYSAAVARDTAIGKRERAR